MKRNIPKEACDSKASFHTGRVILSVIQALLRQCQLMNTVIMINNTLHFLMK